MIIHIPHRLKNMIRDKANQLNRLINKQETGTDIGIIYDYRVILVITIFLKLFWKKGTRGWERSKCKVRKHVDGFFCVWWGEKGLRAKRFYSGCFPKLEVSEISKSKLKLESPTNCDLHIMLVHRHSHSTILVPKARKEHLGLLTDHSFYKCRIQY